MKRLLLFILSFVAVAAYSQTFEDRLHFEAAVGSGLKYKGITPMDYSFRAHIDVANKVDVFVSAESNKSLYHRDDLKTYFSSTSLGGGIGVNLLGKDGGGHALGIRAKVLASIGNADWKRTSYDAGLAWYMNGNNTAFSPLIEIGYKYIDSRTHLLANYSSVYLSFGIRY